jgi:hypothetical protein
VKITGIRILDYGSPKPPPTLRVEADMDGARLIMDYELAPTEALRLAADLVTYVAGHYMHPGPVAVEIPEMN